MNWSALVQMILNVFEKNPALAEQLIGALAQLLVSNQTVLQEAVTTGLAMAKKNIPATPAA